MMRDAIGSNMDHIVDIVMNDYSKGRDIDRMDIANVPDRDAVVDIINKLLHIVYPGYYREHSYRSFNAERQISVVIEDVSYNLAKQIIIALRYDKNYADEDYDTLSDKAADIVIRFFDRMPTIREYLNSDLQATFDGDPAADSKDDIVLSYPGLHAISINRIAHELWLLRVPLIPRMMTEYAHGETGIDIHPGATIGKYFCIDHGTGIVVGSTSNIGNHVKLYQGVTIGALSTKLGQKLHGHKRHPTIEDNVTIYSNASILGGDTVIGHDSVIGGSCFITKSVAPNSRISARTDCNMNLSDIPAEN
jgi:serine O-acetyltransferase